MNAAKTMNGAVYTVGELAKVLRVGAGTIRMMCQTGKLKAFRVGAKHWRVFEVEAKRHWPELFVADRPAA